VKKYVMLHYGFEKPTPEIMAAWGKWFETVKPHTLEMGGFGQGREISKHGNEGLAARCRFHHRLHHRQRRKP
jgi:hypothetical protein